MEPAWSKEALWAWFSPRLGEDVVETELLRVFFPDEDPFSEGMGLELFHKHFLLYRRLWLFDDELRLSTGHRLWIRSIRSTLLAPPPRGRCGWLDGDTGKYCPNETTPEVAELCPLHATTVPEIDGMKSFYLDWKNLEGMTQERLLDLVEGFFRWMGTRSSVPKALQTLGLPADADPQTIKARWRQLSLVHHPDRGGDPAVFQRLSEAWSALKFLET